MLISHQTAASTNRRWAVVAILFSLSMLTIVDRVAISAAKPGMSRDLGLTDVTFGFIFGAFALGYAIFQIPAGYLADRFGPRLLVTAVVGAWSVFTVMTAVAGTTKLLIAIRFLFGGAEAGAFPASARAIRTWLPARETGLAQGILFSGSRLGAAFGLTVVSFAVSTLGWRMSFVVLGGVGVLWIAAWLRWFRDSPETSRGVSEKERAYIRADRTDATRLGHADWASVFALPETPKLLLQYFASNFTFFICFSWLLPYLQERFNLSGREAGLFAAIPLYFGASANWISGGLVDALYRRNWGRSSRIVPATAGFLIGAIALVAAVHAETIWSAALCFAIATFGVDLTLSPSWTLCIDIAGDRTGLLTGAMNTLGNIGSFASSIAFPLLFRWTGTSNAYFYCAAAINVLAALLWLSMRQDLQVLETADLRS
jgi:ACS family glucarate transporter-like MFS transporter